MGRKLQTARAKADGESSFSLKPAKIIKIKDNNYNFPIHARSFG
jgi:hypothetical protein